MKKVLIMSKNDILSNKNKLFVIKSIYLTMLVFYIILSVFLCFTNGSIQYHLQQNILYILLPMSIPLVLSLVGLNNFKIEKDSNFLKIYTNCIFMNIFSDNFSKKIIVNTKEPFENNISTSHFGLRKSLIVTQKLKNKFVTSKVNISLLSSLEKKDLEQKLNIIKSGK